MLISNRNLLLCLIKILILNEERELKIRIIGSSLEVFRELFLILSIHTRIS